ncbi:MAG: hypothetical protein MJD61_14690 [Proteobacteria bacterium]|nr:hypothetical protein [Pseudomonadota bacterium]
MQRRYLLCYLLLTAAGAAVASCTNDMGVPVYVDVTYQLRCRNDCLGKLEAPPRRVRGLDDQTDPIIDCFISVGELTFTAQQGDEYGIRVDNSNLAGPTPDRCRVTVSEGANSFEGSCSGTPPAPPLVPCQLNILPDPSGALLGSLLCVDLPQRLQPSEVRSLEAPGNLPAPQPAAFNLQGCRQL